MRDVVLRLGAARLGLVQRNAALFTYGSSCATYCCPPILCHPQVNLLSAANMPAGAYSGGMRR